MKAATIDTDRLRVALRGLSRNALLTIAERAVDMIAPARLSALVTGCIRPADVTKVRGGRASILEQVRTFHEAAVRGDYYESCNVNSKNYMDTSPGTERFDAEMARLAELSVRATPSAQVRQAFELLFALLRRIDEGDGDTVFFADEAGSWQVAPEWDEVLPAYFRCVAATAEPDEFVQAIEHTINEFARHDLPKYLAVARSAANPKQRAALRRRQGARSRS